MKTIDEPRIPKKRHFESMEDYTVDRKYGRICIKESRLSMSVKVKCDRISCRRLPCYYFLPPSDRRHLEISRRLTLISLLARPKSSGNYTKKTRKNQNRRQNSVPDTRRRNGYHISNHPSRIPISLQRSQSAPIPGCLLSFPLPRKSRISKSSYSRPTFK